MARPKIKSKPVRKYTKRAPAVTEKTLGESIIEQMVQVNTTLVALVATLKERQSSGPSGLTVPQVVAEIAKVEPATPAEVAAAMAPKERQRRRTKAEMAAARAEPTATVPEQAAPTPWPFPKTCACGVREDLPPHLHSHGCPVHGDKNLAATNGSSVAAPAAAPIEKPAPTPVAEKPAPALTMDDIRGVAIAFAGKHGKEKLAGVLAGFKSEKLSAVAPSDYPRLMSALQAGV